MNNTYQWHGISAQGQRINGIESAETSRILYEKLQKKGVCVLKIKKTMNLTVRKSKKISAKQLSEFTRQIGVLCQANIDLINVLQISIQEEKNLELRKLVLAVKENIENGMSLSEALDQFPQYFDKVYCGLVLAGEKSGTLGKMLTQLSHYQEQMLALRAKIIKTLFYPTTVAITATLITIGLLIFVVPQFKNIFNGFGAQLPPFTQTVIQLSDVLQIHAKKCFLLLIISTIIYRYFIHRLTWLNAWRDKLLLRLPLANQLLITTILTRWTRLLATLLTAGISLIDALHISIKTIPNQFLQITIREVICRIVAGDTFYKALSLNTHIPRRMIQMIAVGENAGQLPAMLEKIADMQQATLDRGIDYFSKWLEPAVMMILAIVTGSLIIAMYLPVFKLGSVY